MPKFHRDVCEVCGETVIDIEKLSPEIRAKVYKPSADETYNVQVDLTPPSSFEGYTEPEPIDIDQEIDLSKQEVDISGGTVETVIPTDPDLRD